MYPQPGDILVSSVRATVDFSVSVVPHIANETYSSRERALARGHDLASQLQSDLWRTEDLTHFVLVSSYRSAPAQRC